MKSLNKGELENVNEDLIFPLNTWCSNYEKNEFITRLINRNVFFIDKHLSTLLLSKGITPKPFIPYPKSKKVDDKKFELVIKYLIEEYNYGKSDISSMNNLIIDLINSKSKLEEFSQRYGLDNNERKILGLNPIKFDKKKMEPKKGVDLFSI